jgi:hypothetical protein
LLAGVGAAQVVERATLDAGVARIAHGAHDAVGKHVVTNERAGRRRFVPAGFAVHDECARQRQARQCGRHARGHLVAERADDVERRRRGVRERPQDVEYGAHAQRLADRADGLRRGVVVRREQEREAAVREARSGSRFVERNRQTERGEHVGTARLARYGPIAVLDDGQAARGREQRRARRQIQAARAVSACADDVDVGARRNGGAQRELAHRAREAANLVGRLAFRAQRGQQCARERGGELAAGQRAQQLARRRFVEMLAAQ